MAFPASATSPYVPTTTKESDGSARCGSASDAILWQEKEAKKGPEGHVPPLGTGLRVGYWDAQQATLFETCAVHL